MGPQARQNRSLLMQLAWTIYRNRLSAAAKAKDMVEAEVAHQLSLLAAFGFQVSERQISDARAGAIAKWHWDLQAPSFSECLKCAWAKIKAFEPAALIRKAEIAERREIARYIDDPIIYAHEMKAIRQMELAQ